MFYAPPNKAHLTGRVAPAEVFLATHLSQQGSQQEELLATVAISHLGVPKRPIIVLQKGQPAKVVMWFIVPIHRLPHQVKMEFDPNFPFLFATLSFWVWFAGITLAYAKKTASCCGVFAEQ